MKWQIQILLIISDIKENKRTPEDWTIEAQYYGPHSLKDTFECHH